MTILGLVVKLHNLLIEGLPPKYRTPISDHLPIIYQETLRSHPKVIVELGVGQTTRWFARAADNVLVAPES